MDELEIDEDEQIWVLINQVFPGDLIYAKANIYNRTPYYFNQPCYVNRVSLNGSLGTAWVSKYHGEDAEGDEYISEVETFLDAWYIEPIKTYLLVDR